MAEGRSAPAAPPGPATKARPRSPGVKTAEDAENDAQALRMRTAGFSYREIGAAVGCDGKTAHRRVQRALRAIPSAAAEEYRRISDERLDALVKIAYREATRDHLMVSHGQVVTVIDDEGKVVNVIDHGPKLAAVRELRMLNESWRKLHGADAPTRQRIEVITEDTVQAEIDRLTEELAANDDADDEATASL